ncbi:unnamed protein product, partial [Symbiodinium sp. KB8]
ILGKVRTSLTRASSPESDSDDDDLRPGRAGSHETGNCNPCVLIASRVGCVRGDSCSYCHLPHPEKMKVPHRPRKQTRDKYRLAIHKVIRDHEDGSLWSSVNSKPETVRCPTEHMVLGNRSRSSG